MQCHSKVQHLEDPEFSWRNFDCKTGIQNPYPTRLPPQGSPFSVALSLGWIIKLRLSLNFARMLLSSEKKGTIKPGNGPKFQLLHTRHDVMSHGFLCQHLSAKCYLLYLSTCQGHLKNLPELYCLHSVMYTMSLLFRLRGFDISDTRSLQRPRDVCWRTAWHIVCGTGALGQ